MAGPLVWKAEARTGWLATLPRESPAVRVSDPGCWFFFQSNKDNQDKDPCFLQICRIQSPNFIVLAVYCFFLLPQSIHFFVHSFKKYI